MIRKSASHQHKKKAHLEHRIERAYQGKRELAHKIDRAKQLHREGKLSKAEYIKYAKHASHKHHEKHHKKQIRRHKKHLYKHHHKPFDRQLLMLALVVAMLGFGIVASGFGPGLISGQVTGVKSEAVINQYFAIALSDNLADGITFGTVLFNTTDNNATDNYNGAGSNSTMYVIVSTDSNVNVDTCIKANEDLINDVGNRIGYANITYSYSNVTSATVPGGPGGSTALSGSFVDTLQDITPGFADYFRFWLDVPVDQEPGTYNNTIEFQGVKTGQVCS